MNGVTEKIGKTNSELMVTIRCITYNHEPYIRQCLEGFVMQKTNFRFEAIVHDDASTDGTTGIIQEYAEKYPDIIKPIYETENQYSKHDGSLNRIMNEHTHGKYAAMCEGDDYWIDPLKLQKQVDFLEEHEEYGLVHTYFNYVNTNNEEINPPTPFYQELRNRICDGHIWDYYLVNPGFILTCTCCFRMSLYHSSENIFFDYGLFMMIARQSEVYCLKDITASYRINPNGAMSTSNKYYKIRERNVRIEQLYQFFYNQSSTLDYYRTNSLSQKRIEEAYLHLLIDLILRRVLLNKKLLLITRRFPSLFLKLPWYLILWAKDWIKSKD